MNKSKTDRCTEYVSRYVKDRGIKLAKIANDTKIPYEKVWRSLGGYHSRSLTADEYMAICNFLDLDPIEIHKSQLRSKK